jgi:glyoxylate reductase
MKKVFITRRIPEPGLNYLRQKGFKIEIYSEDRPIPSKQLLTGIKDADAVISLLTDKFDREAIDKMNNCRIIANHAVGFNNIDIDYAKEKKIIVANTPEVLTESTADLTMALVLSSARRLTEAEKFLRDGKFEGWKPMLLQGIELKDKVFGIVGAGRIGFETAKRAKAFGCRIIYFDNEKKANFEKEFSARRVSLNSLMLSSDIVSVHLPLNKKTHHLINRDKLKLMKKSSIIINTARGEIIDEKALISVLEKKQIFAAGLDVFEKEPNVNKKLLKLENVVLLPHIGSATIEARNRMSLLAAKNVAAVLSGNKPLTPV